MARETYVLRNGELMPKRLTQPVERAQSALACPMVIADFKDAVYSHADGKTYTSRRHWRDHLKAHKMIEVGNEKLPPRAPQPVLTEAALSEAYDQCVAGKGVKLRDGPPEGWQGDIDGV